MWIQSRRLPDDSSSASADRLTGSHLQKPDLAPWVLDTSTFYAWRQERMLKRVLAADPTELLIAGRALLASRPGFVGEISPSSPDVPCAIRRLKPTLISVSTNSLGVDFSDVFNPFGIIVYAAGVNPPAEPKSGIGPREWIDGLWLYDDGQLENYGQQVNPPRVDTQP